MKVLILAYDFPPLPSVGGFRPYSWYKYFPETGIFPIVITRKWAENVRNADKMPVGFNDEVEEIESGASLLFKLPHVISQKDLLLGRSGLENKRILRKFLTFSEELLKYKNLYFDDKSYIFRYADEFLAKNKVDCILVTGEPFVLFKYAHKLSKKYNIPWVGDYRDGWSTDHSRPDSFLWQVLNSYYKYNEKKFTRNMDGFSSVSDRLVSDIEAVISKKGIVVSNGVDLDLVDSVSPARNQNNQFILVYTGTIYDGQKIEEFLAAFENFLGKHGSENISVKFIGIETNQCENVSRIMEFAKRHPKNAVILPRMAHKESILEQKNSTLLLNFILGVQSEGLIGGKTYEYLAIKKPILVVPIKEEKNPPLFPGRNFQFFAHTTGQIEVLLEEFYKKFKNGEELTTDITDVELYDISRRKQAVILAEYLKKKIAA